VAGWRRVLWAAVQQRTCGDDDAECVPMRKQAASDWRKPGKITVRDAEPHHRPAWVGRLASQSDDSGQVRFWREVRTLHILCSFLAVIRRDTARPDQ